MDRLDAIEHLINSSTGAFNGNLRQAVDALRALDVDDDELSELLGTEVMEELES